ncbi:7282_t:CDS:2 [Acaulospora morrowiae]|uniref:7282_t:CDS:1 n=1 Tax=Acaulospora morrowiae TaxID=94023 RepID=A0A9N9BID0_9GLOM|nr:7282_t:CDS:2 [Acaulospora morrowiae]
MSLVFDSQAFFLANIPPESTASQDTIKMSSPVSISQPPSPVDFLSSTPPSITRVLTYTSPLVHLFSQFLSLVTWSTGNPSESCLLVAAWWTVCLYPKEIIIYGIPLSLFLLIVLRWVEKGKSERLGKASFASRATSQADLNRTVHEINRISDKLSSFHAFLNTVDSYIDWSNPAQTQKVFFGLIYLSPLWILINWIIPLTWIFIITVTSFLVWNSPWLRVIRSVLMQSPFFRGIVSFILGFVFSGRLKQPGGGFSVGAFLRRAMDKQRKLALKKESSDNDTKTSTDLIFKFVLYENQRWWLGLDWTSNLFPNERPAWSDEYQEPTNHKDSFQLPPPTTTHIPTPEDPNVYIQKTIEWRWTDQEWTIESSDNVDNEGWEYFDNRWKGPSSKGGFRKYTRRRKWVRAAKLVETIQKIQKTKSVTFEEPESEKSNPEDQKIPSSPPSPITPSQQTKIDTM